MGSAPIESVTATLDAAREIGDRIGESIAAQTEVERLLLEDSRIRYRRAATPHIDLESDDDADTPIGGVPATQ